MPQGSGARLFPLAFDALRQDAHNDELFEFGQILEPLRILAEPSPHRWPVGDREDKPFETLRLEARERHPPSLCRVVSARSSDPKIFVAFARPVTLRHSELPRRDERERLHVSPFQESA